LVHDRAKCSATVHTPSPLQSLAWIDDDSNDALHSSKTLEDKMALLTAKLANYSPYMIERVKGAQTTALKKAKERGKGALPIQEKIECSFLPHEYYEG
jgi:hypothetical protein